MVPKQKKSPEDFPVVHELTKEEKQIIEETKVLEKRENIPQKTGVVLTGGIDSSVTLCLVKRTHVMDIQPIVFKDEDQEDNNVTIKSILEHEGITTQIKQFDKVSTKAEKKEVLQWCFENNINPLTFGANMEEDGFNNLRQDMLEWRQISSEMNNFGVDISEPLHTVNKSEIIKWAKDRYGILDLTAKPSDSSKYKKIREEAFATAGVIDPHLPEDTVGEQETIKSVTFGNK